MYRFGRRSMSVLDGLHPLHQQILLAAIKTSPYDFGLHEGIRSLETQYEYFQQGRTKPGKIITWIDGISKRGYHNYKPSLAFDFHCSVPGNTWDYKHPEEDGDPAYMIEIAQHILKVAREEFNTELVWGGDWKSKDYPHIQLPSSYKKEAESKRLYS